MHNPGIIRKSCLAASGALAISIFAFGAANATTTTLNGSGTMTYSFQAVSPNTTPTAPPGGNDYGLGIPGTYTFQDSFGSNQSSLSALATSSVGSYTFQDSYRFTIGAGASGDTLVTSLAYQNIAMQNLQFRLYEVASSSTAPIIPGVPTGSTIITAWMGQTGVNNTSIIGTFSGIQAGTYILDVAGIAGAPGGTASDPGGSYVGTVNLAPVPLPASAWLMLSALGGLGALVRKRRML